MGPANREKTTDGAYEFRWGDPVTVVATLDMGLEDFRISVRHGYDPALMRGALKYLRGRGFRLIDPDDSPEEYDGDWVTLFLEYVK